MMCDVWAMQSAWMQWLDPAAMQARHAYNFEQRLDPAAMQAWHAYNFEGEDDDYTSWQGWQDHIVAELLRIASEGLSVILTRFGRRSNCGWSS